MKLAIVAGDGIGPEVIGEAVKVLDAVLPDVEKTSYDLGARRYHATGEILPDSVLEELNSHDAILLGAIGDPSVPSGVLERGLLLKIRFALDHHINLRPARLYPGVIGPLASNPNIDFVVVREEQGGEDDCRRRAVDEEVVPLDRRPNENRQRDTSHRWPLDSTSRHARSISAHERRCQSATRDITGVAQRGRRLRCSRRTWPPSRMRTRAGF